MTQPLTIQQLDDIARSVAAHFGHDETPENRAARWEAAALAAGREVDRNALTAYLAVADAEQRALADSWARAMAATDNEIRRLRDRVTELEEARRLEWVMPQNVTPHTPRLCECGHSHLAHTVPSPHSCVAHGKTCPCPAYRQLPHDEAVAQLDRNRRGATDSRTTPA
jgi:hypothetical protein